MYQLLCFLLFSLVVHISGWGRGDLEKYGPFQLALNSKLIKCQHDQTMDLDVSLINVYFYDFKNLNHEVFHINDAARGILSIPKLNKKNKFIIFVPGYKSAIHKNTEERVREAFMSLPDSYLIIVDHSAYSNDNEGYIKSYERSVKYVFYIGRAVGIMLGDLKLGGISPKQIHCIGHSLGSQTLSHTGENFFMRTGTKISRITALDPAGPCFSNSLINEQIRSGVAEYVEVYHCNAGGLGTTSVLGDVDFFANKKGESQPNCKTPLIPGVFDSSKAAKCNHKACMQIYLATINHPDWFMASKCDNYKYYKKGMCSMNDVTTAGYWNPGKATGVFYFSTDGYDVQ